MSFYIRIQYSRSKIAGHIYRELRGPPVLEIYEFETKAGLINNVYDSV